jgi:hypothetical protein
MRRCCSTDVFQDSRFRPVYFCGRQRLALHRLAGDPVIDALVAMTL